MEHITTLSLHIESQSSGEHLAWQPFSLGPMLQSVLMEHVDDDYAAQLHASTFNPYSQYCCVGDDGELVWRVSALTDEAAERLIGPASKIDSFTLRNVNETFAVKRRQVDSFGTDHLLGILKGEAGPSFRVRFATPTAFKSKGRYTIMPDVRLIFQNLLMHYNQAYAGDSEIDSEMLEYLTERVSITSYNLRSRYFPRTMDRSDKIPAFAGTVTLRAHGPQSLQGLVAMLLTFGEAAGVGVKTSMGMGGMQLLKEALTRKGGNVGR